MGEHVRVCFRNRCSRPLLLCWVDSNNKPHHFYRLEPTDAGVDSPITSDDHIEQSTIGHAFLLAYPKLNEDDEDDDEKFEQLFQKIQQDKSLDDSAVLVGGYRPSSIGAKNPDDKLWCSHLVEIFPPESEEGCTCCDGGGNGNLRGTGSSAKKWKLQASLSELDRTPYDTSQKKYVETTLGGWPVRLEAGLVKEKTSEEGTYLNELASDLEALCLLLPPRARDQLRDTTPLYVNRSLRYGPAACALTGKGCCFHPDESWLRTHGLSVDKKECVEMYTLKEYHESRKSWGVGGLMLHEFSHAYHWKCLPDGYGNKPVKECYTDAVMKRKAYDCVRVHGPQGPTAKAYACTNQMEYFAELSSAFLGGLRPDEEYNKWFPFNRKQVAEHDPRAYELLQKLWNVNIPEHEEDTTEWSNYD